MPTFTCDSPYHGVPKPLPDTHSFIAFLGPPRSGKSALTTGLCCSTNPKIYAGQFNRVFVLVPKGSFDSMKDNPFKNHHSLAHEFNREILDEIIAECEKSAKLGKESMILIDDFMSSLKENSLRKQLERVIANRRHLKLSVWIISQTYNSIPLSTRKLLSHVAMFKSRLKEAENIREELVPRSREEWEAIYRHVFPVGGDPHAFLWIDVGSGEIYNKFSRLVIDE